MIQHIQNLLLRLRSRSRSQDRLRVDPGSSCIWLSGGWAMMVLAAIALFIFALGFGVLVRLRSKGFRGISEATWRRWIHEPEDRRGAVGELFDEVARLTGADKVDASAAFGELRTHEVEPFIRDLRLMNIAVGAAPLVGLLGTVTGMLSTFKALAAGSGGDKTMAMIAEGIWRRSTRRRRGSWSLCPASSSTTTSPGNSAATRTSSPTPRRSGTEVARGPRARGPRDRARLCPRRGRGTAPRAPGAAAASTTP